MIIILLLLYYYYYYYYHYYIIVSMLRCLRIFLDSASGILMRTEACRRTWRRPNAPYSIIFLKRLILELHVSFIAFPWTFDDSRLMFHDFHNVCYCWLSLLCLELHWIPFENRRFRWLSQDQHSATYWNVWRRIEEHRSTSKHIEAYWSMLRHIETRWGMLQHFAAYQSILSQNEAYWGILKHIEAYWKNQKKWKKSHDSQPRSSQSRIHPCTFSMPAYMHA